MAMHGGVPQWQYVVEMEKKAEQAGASSSDNCYRRRFNHGKCTCILDGKPANDVAQDAWWSWLCGQKQKKKKKKKKKKHTHTHNMNKTPLLV